MSSSVSASATPGVFPVQTLTALYEQGVITADSPITDKQLQPASLDLRLGAKAYRVQAGFLPGANNRVMDRVSDFLMHEVDLRDGGVLERGAVYIVPLQEQLRLPEAVSGLISPKSTTGRLDILTRLIVDEGTSFDYIPAGFTGRLYLEITPLTYSVLVRTGDPLTQLRLRDSNAVLDDAALAQLHERDPLVYIDRAVQPPVLDDGLWLGVDLEGRTEKSIVAYRARRHAPIIDLQKIAHYDVDTFWEPIIRPKSGRLILNPEDFYIMASREYLRVPAAYSCEMMAYETSAGELRVHYAGFFDPGFGCNADGSGGFGTRGVLEVRSHDVPFVLEHGQKICRMVYAHVTEKPTKIYGTAMGSNYAGQGVKLAKQFNMDDHD